MNNHAWEQFYKKRGRYFIEPHELVPQFHRLLLATNARNILDIGCGAGRHSIYFAENGFKVSATDISDEALKLTHKWAKEKKLKVELNRHNAHEPFEYNDNKFDAVIALDSLIYNSTIDLQNSIEEIRRILMPQGFVFFAFPTSKAKSHILQLVFNDNEIEDLLKFRFDMINSKIDKDNYICVFASNIK